MSNQDAIIEITKESIIKKINNATEWQELHDTIVMAFKQIKTFGSNYLNKTP